MPKDQGIAKKLITRPSSCDEILANDGIEAELSAIEDLPVADLRKQWKRQLGCEPPLVQSREILSYLLAWNIQVRSYGDMDLRVKRRLEKISNAIERDSSNHRHGSRPLPAGTLLTREWKGVLHKVAVESVGFSYLDRYYGNLSEIARAITGTRWSGPRFFGLEQRSR